MMCDVRISWSDGVLEWWSDDDVNDFRFWIDTLGFLPSEACSFILGIDLT
jgi:hypothetical protein